MIREADTESKQTDQMHWTVVRTIFSGKFNPS